MADLEMMVSWFSMVQRESGVLWTGQSMPFTFEFSVDSVNFLDTTVYSGRKF